MTKPNATLLAGDLVAIGGGQFKIVPGKPLPSEVSPKIAAQFLQVSRPTIYRLLDQGLLAFRKPSPGKILIQVESLKQHREKSADPEFWARTKGKKV